MIHQYNVLGLQRFNPDNPSLNSACMQYGMHSYTCAHSARFYKCFKHLVNLQGPKWIGRFFLIQSDGRIHSGYVLMRWLVVIGCRWSRITNHLAVAVEHSITVRQSSCKLVVCRNY